MARVKKVLLRPVPPGPGEYSKPIEALEANPTEVVVDANFPSQKAAEAAAFRINSGKRKDWPSSRYYGIYAFNAEAVGDPEDGGSAEMGRWELLVGIKDHMPEVWRKVVEAPGSRKRNADGTEGDDGGDIDSVNDAPSGVDTGRTEGAAAGNREGVFSDA